jgi:mannose-6-phosphate isomerase-like protein (cupin superfamily)
MAGDQKIEIHRGADAQGLMELGAMKMAPITPEQRQGLTALVQAGYLEGDDVKVLVNLPGFSLTRAWLKKDYPLLLHSHDSDCLYYVLAGSLQMGSEELKAGDSFFVPGGAAYQYRPGPDGVEVLEFRHAQEFDFQNYAKNPAFYEKAAVTVAENVAGWREAKRPSEKA